MKKLQNPNDFSIRPSEALDSFAVTRLEMFSIVAAVFYLSLPIASCLVYFRVTGKRVDCLSDRHTIYL